MKGTAILYLLALAFVAQAAKKSKSKLPKTTDKRTKKDLINAEETGRHFEGDIILPLPGLDRSGLLDEKYHWPNGRVPYVIDTAFTKKEVYILKKAMKKYREDTDSCIQFVKRGKEVDFLFFQKYVRGCSSSVGKQGGMQPVRFEAKCFRRFGTILHEMLHALGFFHEQSRTDRDEHVTVVWKNVRDEFRNNFKKYSSSMIGPFGVPYDYNSVMHYSDYAFSDNGKRTIVPKDSKGRIGQREGFSKYDVEKLMNMYNCGEKN